MRMLTYLLTLPTLFMFLALDAMGQPKDMPMLPDIAIVEPAAEVPKELAAFSGKWSGHLSGVKTGSYMSDGFLVVEKIASVREIQVFYAGVGRFGTTNGQPSSYRVNATFTNGGLEFVAGRWTVVCRIADDGELGVTVTSSTGSNRGSFKRIVN